MHFCGVLTVLRDIFRGVKGWGDGTRGPHTTANRTGLLSLHETLEVDREWTSVDAFGNLGNGARLADLVF